MYCTKCGTGLQMGASFCTDCGNRVGEAPLSDVRPGPSKSEKSAVTSESEEAKNSLSTLSLVLGISSVFLFEFILIPIAAVIASSLSLGKANELSKNGALKTGKGVSIAGLILGVIYSLLGFYYLLLW